MVSTQRIVVDNMTFRQPEGEATYVENSSIRTSGLKDKNNIVISFIQGYTCSNRSSKTF